MPSAPLPAPKTSASLKGFARNIDQIRRELERLSAAAKALPAAIKAGQGDAAGPA